MSRRDSALRHEALVYSSDEEFLARVVPFLRAGMAAGDATIAVLTPEKNALLRDALGAEAVRVPFIDANAHYRRPSHALAEYRLRLDDELSRPGVELVRVIGELPIGPARQEQDEWIRYEALINQAWANSPVWVVCGYDSRILPEHVIADALSTHPLVSSGDEPARSVGYKDADEFVDPPSRLRALRDTGGGAPAARLTITREPELADLRRIVGGAARAGGLSSLMVGDVTTAVGELVRDGLRRGTGETSVRVTRDRARWHCDVTGPASEDDDLGLLIARLVSERVEVASGTGAQTVRMTFSGAADARRRILDAASELFYQNGLRATGINTIIAHSGVAKATFFRHFPAKNDLVAAWLQQPAARWFDRLRSELDARSEEAPASRLLSFFDLLGEWFAEDEFRGCAFQNAAAETPAAAHPVRQATQEYALEIRQYLERTADEAGLADPAGSAELLHLLAQGAIATAVVTRSPEPARLARAAAERILVA